MKNLGKNAADNKKNNRGKVLGLIATGRCRTRRDLVDLMGLTKVTISNIVSDFQEKGILMEDEKLSLDKAGRRPVNIKISPSAPRIVGLLVIRDRVEVVLCDFYLHIEYREKVILEHPTEQELIRIICRLVENAIGKAEKVIGIGVSSLGPVDSGDGIIMEPPYFYGIGRLPIVSILETKFSLPVRIHQDNESGALEEYYYGNGKGHESLMLVGIERGVGCGIIKDGKIYSGFHRLSPEIGHVSIDYKGRKCICGNRGCMELYVNSEELKARFEKTFGKGKSLEEYISMQDIPEMDELMDDIMEKLSAGISSTINLLNLDLVILGYDGAYISEKYLNLLERKINKKIFNSSRMTVVVKKPYYLQDAQLLGAVCNILQPVFDGDINIP